MEMDCIDLRSWAKEHGYRWRYEESHKAENDPAARGDGRWYVEIICKKGLIYPWGEQDLLVCIERAGGGPRRGCTKELKKIPGLRNWQGGMVFRFAAEHLDTVAAIMEPKKKRQMSPERRAELSERVKKYGIGGPKSC